VVFGIRPVIPEQRYVFNPLPFIIDFVIYGTLFFAVVYGCFLIYKLARFINNEIFPSTMKPKGRRITEESWNERLPMQRCDLRTSVVVRWPISLFRLILVIDSFIERFSDGSIQSVGQRIIPMNRIEPERSSLISK